MTGGWPCYGGVVDALGRLISVFGAASATFGQVICQTQQSQTNKQTPIAVGGRKNHAVGRTLLVVVLLVKVTNSPCCYVRFCKGLVLEVGHAPSAAPQYSVLSVCQHRPRAGYMCFRGLP
eukprot:sb/3476153/